MTTTFDRSRRNAHVHALGLDDRSIQSIALGKRWIRHRRCGPSPPESPGNPDVRTVRTHNSPLSVTKNKPQETHKCTTTSLNSHSYSSAIRKP